MGPGLASSFAAAPGLDRRSFAPTEGTLEPTAADVPQLGVAPGDIVSAPQQEDIDEIDLLLQP
jgi:hypothetical protein